MEEMEQLSFYERINLVRKELDVPKNRPNNFGGYMYRNCEDIFNAVKPINAKYLMLLTVTDDLIPDKDRYYIKSTACLIDIKTGEKLEAVGYAREEDKRPKMDAPQLTGSSSSYARKYALNALYLIDDVKDPDSNEYREESQNKVKNSGVNNVDKAKQVMQVRERELLNLFERKGKNLEAIKNWVCKQENVNDYNKIPLSKKVGWLNGLKKKYEE